MRIARSAADETNFVAALVPHVQRLGTLWTLRRSQDRLRTAGIASNEMHPLPLSESNIQASRRNALTGQE
jgi:hypothetical protein